MQIVHKNYFLKLEKVYLCYIGGSLMNQPVYVHYVKTDSTN